MATTDPIPDPDATLVTALLREQAPELATGVVRPSSTSGSSNWVFRVGDRYAARLPRSNAYAGDLLTEADWVPRLAPHLSAPVPEVIQLGQPSALFPRPWTLVTWVTGESPADLGTAEQRVLATDLGMFMRELHAVDTFGQEAGDRWGYRCGEPVTDTIDAWVEKAAVELSDYFDPHRVRQAWQLIRDVPPASTPPCWVHTDLSAENLLAATDGRLVGVIDFGGLGIGDRSVDLLYAWSLFDDPARAALCRAAGADDATWLRARAWAFAGPGLVTIQDYRGSMPTRAARLTAMVEAIAAEVGVQLR